LGTPGARRPPVPVAGALHGTGRAARARVRRAAPHSLVGEAARQVPARVHVRLEGAQDPKQPSQRNVNVVLASAANERYGFHLLSMVGSIQTNSPGCFERIVLYDLGLSVQQRRLASSIDGVDLRPMPHFAPHWAQGFTWKPWIWTHLEADAVFYLDAGAM